MSSSTTIFVFHLSVLIGQGLKPEMVIRGSSEEEKNHGKPLQNTSEDLFNESEQFEDSTLIRII